MEGLTESSTLYKLNEFLKCPICYEFCISPVSSCGVGHLVCGPCCARLENGLCVLCKRPLSYNLAMDNMLKELGIVLPCRLTEIGCTARVDASVMSNHLQMCEYREFECDFVTTTGYCPHKSVSINSLLSHWESHHNLVKHLNTDCMMVNEEGNLVLLIPSHSMIDFEGNQIHHFIHQQHSFVWTLIRSEGFLWAYVTYVGFENEANQFEYSVNCDGMGWEGKNSLCTYSDIVMHSVRSHGFCEAEQHGHLAAFNETFIRRAKTVPIQIESPAVVTVFFIVTVRKILG